MKHQVFFCIFIFLLFVLGSQAATLNVPNPYPTIQAAINAAVNGDTVLVANGTYTGTGNVNLNFLGKAITVRSENGPFYCIIDAQDLTRGVLFITNETPSSVLEGFWIKNGYYDGSVTGQGGAGIYCVASSPTIINCIISDCAAKWGGNGGGMQVVDGSPKVTNCTFYHNLSHYDGGGVYNENTAPATKVCAPSFEGCDFLFNNVDSNNGGAMYNDNSWPTIGNCKFVGNFAHFHGAAIYNDHSDTDHYPQIWNSAFFWNNKYYDPYYSHGGAIYNQHSNPDIAHCTFTENGSQECIYNDVYSSPTFLNCILYYDTNAEFGGGGNPNVQYSDVQYGASIYPGTGNINADPKFAGKYTGPGYFDGDIHICVDSPCRGMAYTFYTLPILLTDIEGDPRPTNPPTNFDMGADEFARRLYTVPDYDNDEPFINAGGNAIIRIVGQPTWPCTLFYGTGVLDPPVLTSYGYLYLQNPQFVVAGTIPSSGIFNYPLTVPVTPPGPYEIPMQALLNNWLTNLCIFQVAY